jgi:hypothetical protein
MVSLSNHEAVLRDARIAGNRLPGIVGNSKNFAHVFNAVRSGFVGWSVPDSAGLAASL